MRRNKRDFGRLILIAIFLFVAVLLPNLINAISRAAGTLGTFAAGETGIKLCATISGGNEDALRFNVTNNQGFQADVVVPADTCKNIHTEAATYHVRQYVSQEYAIDSVSGGTISADDSDFVATTSGQYSIVYANTYSQKPYLHNFGYTSSATASSAVEVTFDANGGTGTMAPQSFGLNSQQTLTANAFTRLGYNYDGWNTKADGTGTSYADEQALTFATGGELKLYAQWEETDLASDIPKRQLNDLGDYQIDFTKKALVSDDVAISNGNGANLFKENGQDVYYYRGQINNNNIIWADKCWKIVRTTATGGTKMIYNGKPTLVDGAKQCLATGTDTQISLNIGGVDQNTFVFNSNMHTPAAVGYMYGDSIPVRAVTSGNTVFKFASYTKYYDGIYHNGGNVIEGTWEDKRLEAATRYHYFCTDGTLECDDTKIGYILYYGEKDGFIYYLDIGGYDDIEAAKQAMFRNDHDSNAKTIIETWFETEGLDSYENDLEDAVFCNDRSYAFGSLAGETSDATPSGNTEYSYHGAYARNSVKNSSNNVEPSLDCTSKNDSFTTTETATTNGALNHKIGLITADELTLASSGVFGSSGLSYLYNGEASLTATPSDFNFYYALKYHWSLSSGIDGVHNPQAIRPMVSLKNSMKILDNGADGTTTNPYIVE